MAGTYELFDHTADAGVRVYAATLPELLEPAVRGLYAVIGELEPADGGVESVRLEFTADEPALLLHDFLSELLRRFDTERRYALALGDERFTETALVATVRLAEWDPQRSRLEREAKAITYHELDIRPTADGYVATFIVDI